MHIKLPVLNYYKVLVVEGGGTSSEARVSVGPRVHLHAYRGSGTLSSFNHFDPNADLSARCLTLFIRSYAQALEPMKKGKVKLEWACRLLFIKQSSQAI